MIESGGHRDLMLNELYDLLDSISSSQRSGSADLDLSLAAWVLLMLATIRTFLLQRFDLCVAALYRRLSVSPASELAVHPGSKCNACDKSPIRGTRYVCVNCPCVDLCDQCAAKDGAHPRHHVLLEVPRPLPVAPSTEPKSRDAPLLPKVYAAEEDDPVFSSAPPKVFFFFFLDFCYFFVSSHRKIWSAVCLSGVLF